MILNTRWLSLTHPRTDGLVHISLLQHYHQTHLAGTNILKDFSPEWKHYAVLCKYRYFWAASASQSSILFASHYSNIEESVSQYF